MEKDCQKDPASNPNALLAKVLIGQVVYSLLITTPKEEKTPSTMCGRGYII